MAEFRIVLREQVAYVGLPVQAVATAVPEAVGDAFEQLDSYAAQRDLDLAAGSLVRYRDFSSDAPFTLEVGLILSGRGDPPRVRSPFVLAMLPAGRFAVASQHGPYATIGGLTHELMGWGDRQGLDFALTSAGGIDRWEGWYEWYPAPPAAGPQGLEGPVEVCLLLQA